MRLYQMPSPKQERDPFCRTPTAADIHQVIDLVCNHREMGMGAVIGAPGVGKTTALVRYAEDVPGVHYIAMSPAQSSMSRMLARVCEVLDGHTSITGAADLHEQIIYAIRDRAPKALLIDESQHLDDRSLDELRSIHDATGLPMVFAGNESLRSRVTGSSTAAFAQFSSRIGPRAELKAATVGDVRALAGHHGITDGAAVTWLAKRCVGTSGLRTVARLMALAKGAAGESAVRLSHLKEAAAVLGEENDR